jgi:hypothetical protein
MTNAQATISRVTSAAKQLTRVDSICHATGLHLALRSCATPVISETLGNSAGKLCAHRFDDALVVRLAKDRAACNECVSTGISDAANVFHFHAAIHFQTRSRPEASMILRTLSNLRS